MSTPPLPDVRDPAFLRAHLRQTMAFYDGRCVDPSGGMFQVWRDDGTVLDRHERHLVGSTRFVVTHALMARLFPDDPRAADWHAGLRHALRFVQQVHRSADGERYAWSLRWDGRRAEVTDATQHAYGLAFVLLAHASALHAGLAEARAGLDATWALIQRRFGLAGTPLVADEADDDDRISPYRGQNANMHLCEALLAAHAATGDAHWLAHARTIAEAVTALPHGLAAQGHGLVWEHWDRDWRADWAFNRDRPDDLFRPWGYQVGHQTEWAKLLLLLRRQCGAGDDTAWMLQRAVDLFDTAVGAGWDTAHGGLVYGVVPEGHPRDPGPMRVCDGGKYHWVQAESLAAAALLAADGGHPRHDAWYQRLWAYAWAHFVDHRHGAWFRVLAPDNARVTDIKSPPSKTDYHNLGAVADALAALESRR